MYFPHFNSLNKQKGFTLIELIVVMIIIGILAAIITPKFIDLREESTRAAMDGMRGAVESAWAVAIADRATHPDLVDEGENVYPTNAELAEYVHGGIAATDGNYGIQVEIGGDPYLVITYGGDCQSVVPEDETDHHCDTITEAPDDVTITACAVTTDNDDTPVTCIGHIELIEETV